MIHLGIRCGLVSMIIFGFGFVRWNYSLVKLLASGTFSVHSRRFQSDSLLTHTCCTWSVGRASTEFLHSHSFCFCVSAVQSSHLLPVVTPVPPPQSWPVLLIGRRLFDMFDIRLFLLALSCQLNIRHIPTESGTDACRAATKHSYTDRSSSQSRTLLRILRIRTVKENPGPTYM